MTEQRLSPPFVQAAGVEHYLNGVHAATTDGERVSRALAAQAHALLAVAAAIERVADALGQEEPTPPPPASTGGVPRPADWPDPPGMRREKP